MTQKRIAWLDIAKGLGILLVVVAHTMSPVMEGQVVMGRLYRVLYAFLMPLFFVLAGLVSRRLMDVASAERLTALGKRAKRLMVPYFVWAVIYFPIRIVMKEHVRFNKAYPLWTILIGNNPAGQLWFLYVLFVLSGVAILFVRQKHLKFWCIGGLIVSFFAPMIPPEIALPGIGLTYSLLQVGFFFLGLYLIPHRDTFFNRGSLAWVSGIVVTGYVFGALWGIEFWFCKCLYAAGASYLVCFWANRMKPGKLASLLSYLGKNSMNIYIFHAPILVLVRLVLKPFLGQLPWAYVVVATLGAIGAALAISNLVVRKVKPFRLLLLGE